MLLPSPSAYESTPTPEYVEAMQEAAIQPDARLYLPNRKWHAQRTLSRITPALLPTPSSRDQKGRSARAPVRADGRVRTEEDLLLPDVVALLPTPGAWLGRRPENAVADPERAKSREHSEGRRGDRSIELTDALALLPTPVVQDAKRTTQGPRDGKRGRALRDTLLPTPTWTDARSSGSRNLPGSKAHPGVSLTDAMRFGNSSTPRSGASTAEPSPAGSSSSDDPLPGQLTIWDG